MLRGIGDDAAVVLAHPVCVVSVDAMVDGTHFRLRAGWATPAQVGLAWLLAHAPEVLVIPGTSSLRHLTENVATGQVHLDVDTLAVLDGLGAPSQ